MAPRHGHTTVDGDVMQGLTRLPTTHFPDARGRFLVTWRQDDLVNLEGWQPFVQESLSESRHNVLRGLHLQHPKQQGKLVRVLSGHICDVVVDLRPGSPTFCQWSMHHLDSTEGDALWIPPGLAHGFVVLSPNASVLYQVTAPWDPQGELVLRWDDPALAIPWPVQTAPILSERDATAPTLSTVLNQLSLH